MKKKLLVTLANLTLVMGLSVVSCNSTVEASEMQSKTEKEVEVFTPIKNGPLHKHVSNVYRYGGWSTKDGMNLYNTTPSKVYYNDGSYNGYLYRQATWMEHNFQTNKNRWVSVYEGNVRLVSRGLVSHN